MVSFNTSDTTDPSSSSSSFGVSPSQERASERVRESERECVCVEYSNALRMTYPERAARFYRRNVSQCAGARQRLGRCGLVGQERLNRSAESHLGKSRV